MERWHVIVLSYLFVFVGTGVWALIRHLKHKSMTPVLILGGVALFCLTLMFFALIYKP